MKVLCRSVYDVFKTLDKIIPSFDLEKTCKAPKFCWYDSEKEEYLRPTSYRHFCNMLSTIYPEAQIAWPHCKQIGRYFYLVFNKEHDLSEPEKEQEIDQDIIEQVEKTEEKVETVVEEVSEISNESKESTEVIEETNKEETEVPNFKAMKGPKWSKEAIVKEAEKYGIVLEDAKKPEMLVKFEEEFKNLN